MNYIEQLDLTEINKVHSSAQFFNFFAAHTDTHTFIVYGEHDPSDVCQ